MKQKIGLFREKNELIIPCMPVSFMELLWYGEMIVLTHENQ